MLKSKAQWREDGERAKAYVLEWTDAYYQAKRLRDLTQSDLITLMKSLMALSGLSMRKTAVELGVTPAYLCKVLHSKENCGVELAVRVIEQFNKYKDKESLKCQSVDI